MGELKKNLSNTLYYLLATLVSAAGSLLLLPYLARVLSTEEYALVGLFTYSVVILGPVVGLSVHGAVTVQYYRSEVSNLPRYVGNTVYVLFLTMLLAMSVVLATGRAAEQMFSLNSSLILLAILSSGAAFGCQVYLSVARAERNARAFFRFELGRVVLATLLTLALVSIWGANAGSRIQAIFYSYFFLFLIGFLILRRQRKIEFRPSREYITDLFRYGGPLLPHTLGGVFIAVFDKFYLGRTVGLSEVAIYIVCAQIASCVQLSLDALNKALAPVMFRTLQSAATVEIRKFRRRALMVLLLIAFVCTILALIAYPLLSIVAGPKYIKGVDVLAILFISQIFSAWYLTNANYLFYVKKTFWIGKISLLSCIANTVLVFVLVPLYGIEGAALAFGAGMLMRGFLSQFYARRAVLLILK